MTTATTPQAAPTEAVWREEGGEVGIYEVIMRQKHIEFPLYFTGERWGDLVIPENLLRGDLEILKEQINNALWVIENALLPPEKADEAAEVGEPTL